MSGDDLEELETAVLDGLDEGEDADAPRGTVPLSASRRARSTADAARLLAL